MAITFILSYPATDFIMHGTGGDLRFSFGLGVVPFAALTFILGFFMPLGSAAVFRHIPVYYPNHVGPVGGAVGMVGGLGGFVLPVAFGVLNDLTGLWTSCFMLLFLIAAANLIWMHAAIRRVEQVAAAGADQALEQGLEAGVTT
jgi:NNP family nitrate/nitrite transporter-like MFS transporter